VAAAALDTYSLFIGGEPVEAEGGAQFESVDPTRGHP
jgi:hypothetical protein